MEIHKENVVYATLMTMRRKNKDILVLNTYEIKVLLTPHSTISH
jgi:hypothetical protein